jgi:hypothetical protein
VLPRLDDEDVYAPAFQQPRLRRFEDDVRDETRRVPPDLGEGMWDLVDQNIASWNRIVRWLGQLTALIKAA